MEATHQNQKLEWEARIQKIEAETKTEVNHLKEQNNKIIKLQADTDTANNDYIATLIKTCESKDNQIHHTLQTIQDLETKLQAKDDKIRNLEAKLLSQEISDMDARTQLIKSKRLREHIESFIQSEEDLKALPSSKILNEISHGNLQKKLEKLNDQALNMEFNLIDTTGRLRDEDRIEILDEIQNLKVLQQKLKEYEDLFNKVAEERNIRTDPKSSSAITETPLKFSGAAVPYHFYEFIIAIDNYAQHSSVLEEDKGGLMLQYCEGAAKRYLHAEFPNNVNPKAKDVICRLKIKFGNKNNIISQLTDKHVEIGEIPDYTNDDYKSLSNIENKAEGHIYLMRKTHLLLEDRTNIEDQGLSESSYLDFYLRRVSTFLANKERSDYAIKSLGLTHKEKFSMLEEFFNIIKLRAEGCLSNCHLLYGDKDHYEDNENNEDDEYNQRKPKVIYKYANDGECQLCKLIPNAPLQSNDTRHGFVGKDKIACPGLCPLVREFDMQSKWDVLDGICKSCCEQYNDEDHDENTCEYLDQLPFLKCSVEGCNIRYIFCKEHINANIEELEKYVRKYGTREVTIIPY